jgi:hypothetical protein
MKKGGNRKRELEKSLARVDKIMSKIKATGRQREEIEIALKSILRSPHISGITSTTPEVKYEKEPPQGEKIYGVGKFVFKISIHTRKTRTTFYVRA